MEPLIINRTQADSDYAFENQHEQDLKGAYNPSDLNRVGKWINYLYGSSLMRTNWTYRDILNEMAWEEYFYGIKTFRESLPDVSNIPKIPESIYELINPGGEEKANNIEYMILIHHEKIKTLVQLGTFELGDELI